MSVEFEPNAHKTLTLRSFYRKLTPKQREDYYIPYIQSTNEKEKENNLNILKNRCSEIWAAALHETLGGPHALGNPDKWRKIKAGEKLSAKDYEPTLHEKEIFTRIANVRKDHKGPLIVIGGPPCQAYSVNGRNRQRKEKDYKPENDERFFLYQEYLKVLDAADPDCFVMENVEGILTAKLADGEPIFNRIKRALVMPDKKNKEQYDIYSLAIKPEMQATDSSGPIYSDDHDYVITASDFGVPQERKRVILFGIKRKHGPVSSFMEVSARENTPVVRELIGSLPRLRSGISNKTDGPDTVEQWIKNWESNRADLISILSNNREKKKVVQRLISKEQKERKKSKKPDLSAKELRKKKIEYTKQVNLAFEKTLNQVKKLKMKEPAGNEDASKGNDYFITLGKNFTPFESTFKKKYPELYSWLYRDIGGLANHMTRGHMKEDLKRYMFSASWAKAHSSTASPSPKSKDYPMALTPKHKNWESGNHADRFRTIEADMIPLTITSHLRKDGHAQIHYDATQNRSLTVREAARIQTFPDDYYFEGKQGWQFQQVGNAVPPYLAKKIALYVWGILKDKKLA